MVFEEKLKSCNMGIERISESSFQCVGDENEWEEARCPVCMESPHNAVLLLCSSHEKGCHPYMCDTSDELSNCFDQFCKSSAVVVNEDGVELLTCPLCRGQISSSIVNKPARKLMDSIHRSCSLETCDFRGNYSELRKHALHEHPSVRPAEADPIRRQEWETMLQRNELHDLQFAGGWSYVDSSSWYVPSVSISRTLMDNFIRHGNVIGSTSTEEELHVEIHFDTDQPAEDAEWETTVQQNDSTSFAPIQFSISRPVLNNLLMHEYGLSIPNREEEWDIHYGSPLGSENYSSTAMFYRETFPHQKETNSYMHNSSSRAIYLEPPTRPRRSTRSDFPYVPATRPSRRSRSDFRGHVTRQRNNNRSRLEQHGHGQQARRGRR